MKKFNKILISLLGLFTIGGMSSCSASSFEIEFEDVTPSAIVGEEYDFGNVLIETPGVKYSLTIYYQDYYNKEEHQLEANGLKFTPTEPFDLCVHVLASKGSVSKERIKYLDVVERGDPIDELLMTNGWSGWCDPGFSKFLNKDVKYLHDKESKTSLIVSYSGNNTYSFGGSVLCLENFRCLDYWTDKDWKNAILTFYVYNPTDYDLEFQLRIKDNSKYGSTDIDWGQDGNITTVAKPGKWTQAFYSLRQYGVTHTLFINEDGSRKDSFIIKTRWKGTPTEEQTPVYSYQFYVDGVDIVPASTYPDVNTSRPTEIEAAVLTAWKDDGLKATYNFAETDKIKFDEASIKYQYEGSQPYQSGATFMCLSGTVINSLWTDREWDNAILTYWIYNDSEQDLEFACRIFDSQHEVDFDWGASEEINPITKAKPHEWTQVFFSLNKAQIHEILLDINDQEFMVKVRYAGRKSTQYNYTFFMDGLDIVPASTYPEVDTFFPDMVDNIIITSYSDPGISKKAAYEEGDILTEKSSSSVEFTYSGKNEFKAGASAICLNDVRLLSYYTDKTWEDSIFTCFIKNTCDATLTFQLRLYAKTMKVNLDWRDEATDYQTVAPGETKQIFFGLKKYGVTGPMFVGTYNNETRTGNDRDEFFVKVKSSNATKEENYSFSFLADGFDVVPSSTYPDVNVIDL